MELLDEQDAYGRLPLDAFEGAPGVEIVERDDGFVMGSPVAPRNYFAPFRSWPSHQRQAMRFARGRVLDVGAGAGRVALHLQRRGQEVVAIDVSPLAVEVARRRGVGDARVLSITDVDQALAPIDTVGETRRRTSRECRGEALKHSPGKRVRRALEAIPAVLASWLVRSDRRPAGQAGRDG